MIKRYGFVGWEAFDEKDNGLYVLYTDHLAAMQEKDREIERLKAALNEIATTELICPEMKEKCEYMSDIALKALKEEGDGSTV